MKKLPKFLTEEMAEEAIEMVWWMVLNHEPTHFKPKSKACHVVVLVPEQETPDELNAVGRYLNYSVRPYSLFEYSFGNKESEWTADYAEIARSKALKLWNGMNDGRTDIMPHLMYSGDCPFWGGVKRDGIVVACSGVEAHFDRMISGMVADMLIAGAYHAWMNSNDKKENRVNLS
ncbi:MAG: hypothetical protein NTU76_02630 [Candidatus Taylorbacteria bacterium]|nr:hypothetical protein [Candidatus Taylorbacteria bacterium]